MTKTWAKRTVVLLLCVAFSCFWAAAMRRVTPGPVKAIDFASMYYAAHCVIEHRDPYIFLGRCMAEGGFFTVPGVKNAEQMGPGSGWTEVYPPTALLMFVPFAMLSLPVATTVWTRLVAGLLVLAGLAMWDLGGDAAVLSGCLACWVLLNCEVVLTVGNPGVMVASSGVIGAWCLFKERYVPVGVLLLAASLTMKPHVAGFVWLYFLLAGGIRRKRALQTLAVSAILGICAVIWIAPYAPHWMAEIRTNFAGQDARGGPADLGPTGSANESSGPIVSLQNSVSLIKNDTRFYDPVTYLLVGSLIAIWAVAVKRKHRSREEDLLALAAISVLTLLPVYHRTYNAKLLLLTIPAVAVLWARKGARRWFATALTASAIFVTADVPQLMASRATSHLPVAIDSVKGRLMLLLFHPAPLVLFATGCFYLWEFIRFGADQAAPKTDAVNTRTVAAT